MSKLKLLLTAAVVAAMGSVTGVTYASTNDASSGSAGSAMAAEFCPNGYVCLYEGVDRQGQMLKIRQGHYVSNLMDMACKGCDGPNVPGNWDNDASSWYNKTGLNYCVSWFPNGGNPDNTMPAGSFGNFTTTGWNDQASSIGHINCP